MTIETRALGFAMTEAIRRHLERRVRAALAPVARRVVGVTARVRDVNARRGGIDKRCRLVAGFRRRRRRGGRVVVAGATHADLYAAIDAAAARLRRSAVRAARRPAARERKDPQRPGTLVVSA